MSIATYTREPFTSQRLYGSSQDHELKGRTSDDPIRPCASQRFIVGEMTDFSLGETVG